MGKHILREFLSMTFHPLLHPLLVKLIDKDNQYEGCCLLLHIETLLKMCNIPESFEHIQIFIQLFEIYFLDRPQQCVP